MDPEARRKVYYQIPVREKKTETTKKAGYKVRYEHPEEKSRIKAAAPKEDGVYMNDPKSWDLHYAFLRKQIQANTSKLLRELKDDQKAPDIKLERHELFQKENNWLKVVEKQAHAQIRPPTPTFTRKIIATFYTWEERRIYFHIWRSDFNYEHVKKVVAQNAPYTSDTIDVLAVTVGTDRIEKFDPEHIKQDIKIFLICAPTLFVIRVKHKDSSDLLISTSPLETVSHLKHEIHKRKCYPLHRMDLIYNGHCMEHSRRLFHYDLRDRSLVHLFLQPGCFMHVTVTGFWKKVYDIEIDYTATAQEIITMVIKQCMTTNAGEYFIAENYIRPHFLVLHSPHHYFFGMDEGVYRILQDENTSQLIISQRESAHKVTLRVTNCPEGDEYVKIDSEGHYGVAYMNLHGLVNLPLDRIILKIPGKTLNPYDGVRQREDGTEVELMLSEKQELLPKNIPINIVLRSGITVPIAVNVRQDISDIYFEIERLGYKEADKLNLYHNGKVLPLDATVFDARIEKGDYLHLCAHYYPIEIVQLKGFKKQVKVQCKGKISRLIGKANEIFPTQYGITKYIFGGKEIIWAKKIDQLELWPGCVVFQEIEEQHTVVQVVYKSETVVLEMENDDFTFLVREKFNHWNLPMSAMDSLEQLLVWRVTRPSYTEMRPTAKPIKVTEEIIDNTNLKPEIDYDKYRSPPPTEKPFRLGARPEKLGQIISLPPVVLYEVPLTMQMEKEEGIPSLLYKKENRNRKEKNARKMQKSWQKTQ